MGLSDGGLSSGGLRAVSFSRDSAGKEERLRKWQEKKKLTHHEREHKRNKWTASKHRLEVAAEVDSIECAADIGVRGWTIISEARKAGATVVIIPSLRRLGVGLAQMYWRKQIEAAGLTIVSENQRESEILACEPSARRDKDLGAIAIDDEYEWAKNKQRLAQAHIDWHATPEWQRTLTFIAERPDVSLAKLARILETREFKTLTGRKTWSPMQVLRARREAAVTERPGYVPHTEEVSK